MPDIDLGFLVHPSPLWWLGLILALAVGGWAYYRLAAPLQRGERIVLHAARWIALALLLLLLLEPLLTLRREDAGRPRLAVLVDRSSSMRLPSGREGGSGGGSEVGNEGDRRAQAAAALERIENRLGSTFDIDVYGFNTGLEPRRPGVAGLPWEPLGATALGEVLEEVLLRQGEAPLGAILLLSDGAHTTGKDPSRVARNLPVPLYTVLVGDSTPPADLQLREVRAQPVGHVGEPLALRAVLQSEGLAEWRAEVRVFEHEDGLGELGATGREVAHETLTLPRARGEREVSLEVIPRQVGVRLYEVIATIPDSEAVEINNRRLVAVDVREKKTRLLYLEGEPDWDFSFLKRTLDADTTLSYAYLVHQEGGGFLGYGDDAPDALPASAAELAPYAAVIIGRLGPGACPRGFTAALRRYVLDGGGVLFLGGAEGDGLGEWEAAGWGDLLPVGVGAQRRWGFTLSACRMTFAGLTHEITALDESPAETERMWSAFPPVWIREGAYRTAPGATVLLEGRAAHPVRDVPLLAIAAAGSGRIGVLAGRGFWRWDFVMHSVDAGPWAARDFWKRITRWLSEPAEQERFALRPARRVFQDSEPVVFSARLHDDAYRPVSGARIEVVIEPLDRVADRAAGASLRMQLFPEGGAGRYAGTLAPLPPGAYRYQAVARGGEAADAPSRQTEGVFWIESMGPEYFSLVASAGLMERLAAETGGASCPADEIDALLAEIPEGYRRAHVVQQAEMWNHWGIYAFLTAILALEWIWRRRRGLA
ncbi:MAG: VWA domain-containing protein [Candidatus Eisenbacteria sp.]|nr:VWA domain-containing protein [Candidatus Eisenbacteria bacterium]